MNSKTRRSGFATLMGALALLANSLACFELPPPANVVIFVVDTLRADHLGAYGYERATSPTIDALAADGVLFERASTVAPRTWQSFTSILTGLYPPRHGVRFVFSRPLPAEIPTLASELGKAGYTTAAFDGMAFLRQMTANRQFQEYVDPPVGDMAGDPQVVQNFIAWLERSKGPYFGFLRLSAPHWQYVCPPVFHGQVAGHDAISHAFNAGTHGLGTGKLGGIAIRDKAAYYERFYGYKPTPVEAEHMRLHYDECVHQSDHEIDRALSAMRDMDLLKNTLIVITADHGEAFGEHGYLQHGPQVDEPVMHVPLILRFPKTLNIEREKVRISQQVRVTDIFPTVLGILGLDVPEGLDGRSLLPAIDQGRNLSFVAYGESGRSFVGIDPDRHFAGPRGKVRMVRSRNWKLVHVPNRSGGEDRLYNLVEDPGETRNVIAEHPQIHRQLRGELDTVLAREPQRRPAGGRSIDDLSDEERAQLEALGYL